MVTDNNKPTPEEIKAVADQTIVELAIFVLQATNASDDARLAEIESAVMKHVDKKTLIAMVQQTSQQQATPQQQAAATYQAQQAKWDEILERQRQDHARMNEAIIAQLEKAVNDGAR